MRGLPALFSFTLPIAQSHPWTTTVPVNEFDSGRFERAANG
jgi:hypothetical protein